MADTHPNTGPVTAAIRAMSEGAVPALTAADLNTEVNHEPRILDVRLAEALGYDRPADIRPLVERHQDALGRLGAIIRTVRKNGGRGRPAQENWLTKKQALYLCTKSETERATEITIQVVEVFDAVATGREVVMPESRQKRPGRAAGPLTRADLETYATWLYFERAAVLAEIHPNGVPLPVGVTISNPGASYHRARAGEFVPPPSARALAVLRFVGCKTPRRIAAS